MKNSDSTDSSTDTDADNYEDDPTMLDPAPGPVRKIPPNARRLGGAVPVRFNPETIARIKEAADKESCTVSAWIRSAVDQALAAHEDRAVGVPTVFEVKTGSSQHSTRATSATILSAFSDVIHRTGELVSHG